jgi:GT2 family glycosyltransferase
MIRNARTGVVVLNYGEASDTLGCLDSLEQSDDLDLDIVVVDNGPASDEHDALRAGVGRRAEVVASGDNLGYAGGNNLGITRLLDRGVEFVWLLNPDTRVEPATLSWLLRLMDKRPECGVVGPRLVLPGTPPRVWYDGGIVDPDRCGATRHRAQGRLESKAPRPRARETDYVTGAALLARAQTLTAVGLLPERYFLYFEETEWCLRARRLGWTCVVQSHARMTHLKRSGIGLPEPYHVYYMTRNRYFFARDCLGLDPEAAFADLDAHQLTRWRSKVAEDAPDWLPAYDELVARAKADARAGRDGRTDDITDYPRPPRPDRRPGDQRLQPLRGRR